MQQSIVLQICAQHKVHPVEFFGPGRDRRLSRTRRAAILALKRAGFSNAAVARLIKRNYSTVQYWLHPDYRARRATYFRVLRQKRATLQ